jgi:hypothetical protein
MTVQRAQAVGCVLPSRQGGGTLVVTVTDGL